MNTSILRVLFAILLSTVFGAAQAIPVTYVEAVNTSSLAGTTGSFDLQFNPGPLVTQSATLEIVNFYSDGALVGLSEITGNVSGTLATTLAFDNGSGFNDYFHGFTFGSSISFNIRISGPAIDSPDGISTSGSVFAFSMFSDLAGTVPALTNDTVNGFADVITVNLDGSTMRTSWLVTTVPEPESSALLIVGLGLLGFLGSRKQRVTS